MYLLAGAGAELAAAAAVSMGLKQERVTARVAEAMLAGEDVGNGRDAASGQEKLLSGPAE